MSTQAHSRAAAATTLGALVDEALSPSRLRGVAHAEDWPEPHRRRHLLRLWLRDPGGRPIPAEQRDSRRGKGVQIDGLRMTVPLDVEVAAAEKLYADFQLTVTNPGGHSSMPVLGVPIPVLILIFLVRGCT